MRECPVSIIQLVVTKVIMRRGEVRTPDFLLISCFDPQKLNGGRFEKIRVGLHATTKSSLDSFIYCQAKQLSMFCLVINLCNGE